MAEAAAVDCKSSETAAMQWLALAITPGLGPTKARKLVDFFLSIQALFKASLTELESAGFALCQLRHWELAGRENLPKTN
ncbi:MAG: protecting protein DprA [Acidobacteriaceae bacterium]|nr:protecting protein DprA [Acidobacteriaceae bacterium]